ALLGEGDRAVEEFLAADALLHAVAAQQPRRRGPAEQAARRGYPHPVLAIHAQAAGADRGQAVRGAGRIGAAPPAAAALVALQAGQALQPQRVGAVEVEGEHARAGGGVYGDELAAGRVQARQAGGGGDPWLAVAVEGHRLGLAAAHGAIATGRPGPQHGAADRIALLDAAALARQPQAAVGRDAQDVDETGQDMVGVAAAIPLVDGAVGRHAHQAPGRAADPDAAVRVLGEREHPHVAQAVAHVVAESGDLAGGVDVFDHAVVGAEPDAAAVGRREGAVEVAFEHAAAARELGDVAPV